MAKYYGIDAKKFEYIKIVREIPSTVIYHDLNHDEVLDTSTELFEHYRGGLWHSLWDVYVTHKVIDIPEDFDEKYLLVPLSPDLISEVENSLDSSALVHPSNFSTYANQAEALYRLEKGICDGKKCNPSQLGTAASLLANDRYFFVIEKVVALAKEKIQFPQIAYESAKVFAENKNWRNLQIVSQLLMEQGPDNTKVDALAWHNQSLIGQKQPEEVKKEVPEAMPPPATPKAKAKPKPKQAPKPRPSSKVIELPTFRLKRN